MRVCVCVCMCVCVCVCVKFNQIVIIFLLQRETKLMEVTKTLHASVANVKLLEEQLENVRVVFGCTFLLGGYPLHGKLKCRPDRLA